MSINSQTGLTLFSFLLFLLSSISVYYGFLDKKEAEKFALLHKKLRLTIAIFLTIAPLLPSLGVFLNFSKDYPLLKLIIPLLLTIYLVSLFFFFYKTTKMDSLESKRVFLLAIILLSFLILTVDAILIYLILSFNRSQIYYLTITMLIFLTLFLSFTIIFLSKRKTHFLNSSNM